MHVILKVIKTKIIFYSAIIAFFTINTMLIAVGIFIKFLPENLDINFI